MKRAHVHHIDDNPLNNTLRNLEVLCPDCHVKKGNRKKDNSNFHIAVIFKPAFRQKILENAKHKCASCKCIVSDREHLRCARCQKVTPKKQSVKWPSGRFWFRECFDDYVDKI